MPALIEDKQTQEGLAEARKEMATLIHPDKPATDKTARLPVEVGSPEAQRLFGEGYVLEESPGTPTKGAIQATTGRVATGKPLTSGGAFAQAVQQKAAAKVQEKRDTLLNAPENYDTQIALQRGALFQALAEGLTALTPENLRWLTPQQQQMIRNGDKDLMKSAIVGLNSILQFRKEARLEEEARQQREQAKLLAEEEKEYERAASAFKVYVDNGLWETLTPEARAGFEATFGFEPGTIDLMEEHSKDPDFTYEQKSTERGGWIEFKMDASGQVVDQKTLVESRPLASGGGSSGSVETTDPEVILWADAIEAGTKTISDITDDRLAGKVNTELLRRQGGALPDLTAEEMISFFEAEEDPAGARDEMIALGYDSSLVNEAYSTFSEDSGSFFEDAEGPIDWLKGLFGGGDFSVGNENVSISTPSPSVIRPEFTTPKVPPIKL